VRRFAVAGESLTVTGTVQNVREGGSGRAFVDVDLTETRGSDAETCVEAKATIDVPASWIVAGELS
jgi:hypothetical protein